MTSGPRSFHRRRYSLSLCLSRASSPPRDLSPGCGCVTTIINIIIIAAAVAAAVVVLSRKIAWDVVQGNKQYSS